MQALAEKDEGGARAIFSSIGVYLAHTLALYSRFYDVKYLLLLGRVTSGIGGELILAACKQVLQEEYPTLAQRMCVMLPDEKTRRVGQSAAAASLPEIKK